MNEYEDDLDSIDEFTPVSYFPHKFTDIWEIVQEKFKKEFKDLSEINTTFYKNKSDLLSEIEKTYPEQASEFFKVFSSISKLVLSIDKIFLKDEIELLKRGTTGSIILTRKQVALIFILGFFDIFAMDMKKMCVYYRYDFSPIYDANKGVCLEKGRSFINYMTIIGKWLEENNPILEEKVTYIREKKDFSIKDFDNMKLYEIEIDTKKSLFDSEASFCIDFANRYIGGGALQRGCVQEEILFAVEPEAIVSMFLMERMDLNDAIRIDNLIQFSKYSGYGGSFKYEESLIKNIKDEKLIKHNIIAIDAICKFGGGLLDKDDIERDIIKAYVGFNLVNYEEEGVSKMKKTISTGNWGCGAFGGDFELKFLQQWLASSYAGVEKLYYYTFGCKEMDKVVENKDKIKSFNTGELYELLMNEELEKGKVLDIILKNDKHKKNNKNNKNGKKDKKDKKKKCIIV